MSKNDLTEAIEKFLDSCFKTVNSTNLLTKEVKKTGAQAYSKSNNGNYSDFKIEVSNMMGYSFYEVPWIVFLAQNNKTEKGVYPLILADVKDALKNKEALRVDVCYGISYKNTPDKMWQNNVLTKEKTHYAGSFPTCRVNKTFYFKNIDDFNSQKNAVIEALDEVVQEFKNTFK